MDKPLGLVELGKLVLLHPMFSGRAGMIPENVSLTYNQKQQSWTIRDLRPEGLGATLQRVLDFKGRPNIVAALFLSGVIVTAHRDSSFQELAHLYNMV